MRLYKHSVELARLCHLRDFRYIEDLPIGGRLLQEINNMADTGCSFSSDEAQQLATLILNYIEKKTRKSFRDHMDDSDVRLRQNILAAVARLRSKMRGEDENRLPFPD